MSRMPQALGHRAGLVRVVGAESRPRTAGGCPGDATGRAGQRRLGQYEYVGRSGCHRPLRQRRGHVQCGLARRDSRLADSGHSADARGRGAGSGARPGGNPALRRGQGEPVFSARLQPRSRYRLCQQRRWRAGQHAHQRPWPGLQRHQLPDPRAGRSHRLSQGTVLRPERGFLLGRLGRRAVSQHAQYADAQSHRGRGRLSARPVHLLVSAAIRRPPVPWRKGRTCSPRWN